MLFFFYSDNFLLSTNFDSGVDLQLNNLLIKLNRKISYFYFFFISAKHAKTERT